MKKQFKIDERLVGQGCPAFIIAEIGRNHNGDMDLAKKLIDAAAKAGADAVKFQSFTAENLLIKELDAVSHVSETGGGKSIYELTEEVELSVNQHRELQAYAGKIGVTFFSTPEDHQMARLLAELSVPVFKIASLDINYIDLIQEIAKAGKPIILSTGMAYLSEVETALLALEEAGRSEVIVLQCTSNYPPKDEDINLRAMNTIAEAFDVPVGFSDHSMGIGASIAAVALGACVIERHFTLARNLPGVDHRISLNPDELQQMVREIRTVEKALGSSAKRPVEGEMEMRRLHRRRLVAAHDISDGATIQRKDIACKCSEHGLNPDSIANIIGRKVIGGFKKDEPILSDRLA